MPLKPIKTKQRILADGMTAEKAVNVAKMIKTRWPEAEPIILKDPYSAYEYAKEIIKGRWPEAEPTISKNSLAAYYYARDVIKGRWPQGEKAINRKHYFKRGYQHFLANL